MNSLFENNKFRGLSLLFVILILILSVVAYLELQSCEYILRIICIPTLMILYYLNSVSKSKIFLFSLLMATVSNILFIPNDIFYLKYGLIAFLIYRIITLFIVLKSSPKLAFFSVAIGSIFFLFPLLYFIILIEESMGESFFVGLINIILVSILGGMALTNYLLESNLKHISLLSSTLLYTFLVLLFVIQKYFLHISIFNPLRVILLMAAHYIFCMYVLLVENEKSISNVKL